MIVRHSFYNPINDRRNEKTVPGRAVKIRATMDEDPGPRRHGPPQSARATRSRDGETRALESLVRVRLSVLPIRLLVRWPHGWSRHVIICVQQAHMHAYSQVWQSAGTAAINGRPNCHLPTPFVLSCFDGFIHRLFTRSRSLAPSAIW